MTEIYKLKFNIGLLCCNITFKKIISLNVSLKTCYYGRRKLINICWCYVLRNLNLFASVRSHFNRSVWCLSSHRFALVETSGQYRLWHISLAKCIMLVIYQYNNVASLWSYLSVMNYMSARRFPNHQSFTNYFAYEKRECVCWCWTEWRTGVPLFLWTGSRI